MDWRNLRCSKSDDDENDVKIGPGTFSLMDFEMFSVLNADEDHLHGDRSIRVECICKREVALSKNLRLREKVLLS